MQMFLKINVSVRQSINKIGNERIACQKYGRSIDYKDKYSHKKEPMFITSLSLWKQLIF